MRPGYKGPEFIPNSSLLFYAFMYILVYFGLRLKGDL